MMQMVFDEKTQSVNGRGYSVRKVGAKWQPPFDDIFHYEDNDREFYFTAERTDVAEDVNPIKLSRRDDYVVTRMWGVDDAVVKTQVPADSSIRDTDKENVRQALLLMRLEEYDRKPAKAVIFRIGYQLPRPRAKASWAMHYFIAALYLVGLVVAVGATLYLAKRLGWSHELSVLAGVGAFCVWRFLFMGRSF
jgi:hypothetical protein